MCFFIVERKGVCVQLLYIRSGSRACHIKRKKFHNLEKRQLNTFVICRPVKGDYIHLHTAGEYIFKVSVSIKTLYKTKYNEKSRTLNLYIGVINDPCVCPVQVLRYSDSQNVMI